MEVQGKIVERGGISRRNELGTEVGGIKKRHWKRGRAVEAVVGDV